MRGSSSFVFEKFVTSLSPAAGVILTLVLSATLVFADPPAKPKNPGPLDIPDSQVLKMSIDQYIGAYEKKHNGDIREFEERALCYYYAELSRDRNIRLARQLSPSRRKLVTRCQKVFDDLTRTCNEYQYDTMGGTIISDFYASLEVDNEAVMHKVVTNLRVSHGSNQRYRHDANESYLAALKALRQSHELLYEQEFPYGSTKEERVADYHSVERTLRKAKTVLNSLPDRARRDFAKQLDEIVETLNAES